MSSAWQPNYDEALVPVYSLPDPLLCSDGTRVRDVAMWESKRRPELLELFREHMFGRMPGKPAGMHWEILEEGTALDGRARRRQVRVYLAEGKVEPYFDILLYVPADRPGPVPAFLTYNFRGNASIHPDPAILLTEHWVQNDQACQVTNNRAGEESRGTRSRRWAVDRILARGYALATIYYGDIDPDFNDDFANGVHPLFLKMGVPRASLSSISAWAWGLSRGLDYLETDAAIDAAHVAVMGHSRLGKTALWAGATDTRFAMVVSNDSGCGGAALSRRCFGETVWRINSAMPHWFCAKFHEYNDRENELPLDQHELIALCAPRPTYVASAAEDLWADPKGEFLSAYHAGPVYALYGLEGPASAEFPALHQPVGEQLRYHVRAGVHDVTEYDWEGYLDLADQTMMAKRGQ